MSEVVAPVTHACPNCGADAPHEYCARCGQSQRDRLRVSLRTLAAEGVEELTDLDGKIWATLRTLVARPGLLTREYLAGRRARYVRPLRLYLSASVAFFLVFAIVRETADDAPRSVFGVQLADDGPETVGPGLTVGGDAGDSRAERAIEDRVARFTRETSPAERRQWIGDTVVRHMPKAFFALVPVFALLLRAVHPRHGVTVAEHLILALHVHTFGFLLATAVTLLPGTIGEAAEVVLVAWLAAHLFVALRRVYGRSRGRTLATMALVLPVYALATLGAVLVVVFATLLV